jgi:hypothetical protein
MVRLRSTFEIEVSLPFLAGPENASVSGTAVSHNNLIEFQDTIPIRLATNQVLCPQNTKYEKWPPLVISFQKSG